MAAHLPSKVLLGSRFWHQYRLVLDLAMQRAKIWVDCKWVRRRVTRRAGSAVDAETAAAISDADVDAAIKDMDLSQFHSERSGQEKLRKLLWDRRLVFKGLGKLMGSSTTSSWLLVLSPSAAR